MFIMMTFIMHMKYGRMETVAGSSFFGNDVTRLYMFIMMTVIVDMK